MKKITMIIVMAALCFFFKVKAQSRNQQTTTTSASLASYKAKLVILDFWATSCSGCIQAFPKLELLQKEFTGQVQFVKITSEKKAKVVAFLDKMYKDHPSLIPVITDDTVYRKKYPHIYIPHYVWLDEKREVIAVTSSEDITAKKIEIVLRTGKLITEQKVDHRPNKPLFLDTNLLNNHELVHYSLLYKGRYPGLPSGYMPVKNNSGCETGFTISNRSIGDMFSLIASHLFGFNGELLDKKRRIILVKDSSNLFYSKGKFPNRGFYTYINHSAGISDTAIYRNALNDLNRYSDYRGSIEKKQLKCFIITATDKASGLENLVDKKQVDLLLLRFDIFPFINLPVVNESGYTVRRSFQFSQHMDIASLQEELKIYGLKLIEGRKEMNVFVLRDK